jgi:hypothetical protein
MCNAEKGVQKDKRNQRWTTELVEKSVEKGEAKPALDNKTC